MAIGVRDITNLEELLEVQDDDKIIVIQNGEAKLVSKANAKFGGGTVTVFYAADLPSKNDPVRLVDINGNAISAQVAYDAIMSGPVYITFMVPELQQQAGYLAVVNYKYENTDGNITSVLLADFLQYLYYAGAKPSGGVS